MTGVRGQPAVRADRWLSAARVFKSRTQATEACAEGRVWVNGAKVDADGAVRVGDKLEVRRHPGDRSLEVKALGDKRLSPALARELYVDHTPPPVAPSAQAPPRRDRGAGRPTKQDRRAMDKLTRAPGAEPGDADDDD